jgi:hypothetical protein
MIHDPDSLLFGVDAKVDRAGELKREIILTRGDHLCALYDTDQGRTLTAAPFLLEGLEEGSMCVVMGAGEYRTDILKEMKRQHSRLKGSIDSERLVFADFQQNPTAQFDFFDKRFSEAKDSASTFRVFGEMSASRDRMGSGGLLVLESEFDDVIVSQHSVVAMCGYDVRKFSGIELFIALRSHRNGFREVEKAKPA